MGKVEKLEQSDQKNNPPLIQIPYVPTAVANLLIFGVLIAGWISIKFNSKFYYLSIQEDQIIEWMSFWAFFIAGGVYLKAAYRQYNVMSKFPWFLIAVSLFCFFVAMEEISWGQRLLGYRPSAYFLEQNFQQEFNIHNVVDSYLRVLALKIVILGFGVVLPAVYLIPATRRLCWKMAIIPAPIFLAPAFIVTYCLYEVYPWKFSGELVELMLGLGFVFSATAIVSFFKSQTGRRPFLSLSIIVVMSAIVILSIIMTFASQVRLSNQPELVEVTKKEVIALGNDFRKAMRLALEPITHCKLHNRIYAHVEKYQIYGLYGGYFQDLIKQGLSEERAQFFIDPWNTAYWIRQTCDSEQKKVKVFIYSFGPNRRRDSDPWEIKGDDIGIPIYESGFKKK